MTRDEGASRLIKIIRDVFDADDLEYDDKLATGGSEESDSWTQVRLFVAAEKEFGMRFTSGDFDAFKNAGQMLDIILMRSSLA